MILHRVRVSNYRIHRVLEVELARTCTLVGGPNESGKSTLAEAIHRVLFLRAKTGGELLKEMRSELFAGVPEVTLEFTAGETRYTLTKSFNGARGSTRLQAAAGKVWQDDDAEEQLAGLLGSEAPQGGRMTSDKLLAAWEHLWVLQGSAGKAPAELVPARQGDLVAALQSQGGVAVVQSSGDRAVAELVNAAFVATWQANGKSERAASALAQRKAERSEAEKRLRDAEAKWEQVAENVRKLEQADAELAENKVGLLQLQLEEAQDQFSAWQTLEAARRDREERHGEVTEALKQLQREHKKVDEAEADVASMTRSLTEQATRRDALRDAAAERETDLAAADRALAASRESHDLAGKRKERLSLQLRSAQNRVDLRRVEEDLQTIAQLQAEQVRVSSQLGQLAPVSDEDLDRLRSLDTEAQVASRELDALGVALELLHPGQPVLVDGVLLEPGVPVRLAAARDLVLGDGTTVHITPGGARSLEQARQHLDEQRRLLRQALAEVGVGSIEEATRVRQQRAQLDSTQQQSEVQLKALAPATKAARQQALLEERGELEARLAKELSAHEEPPAELEPEALVAAERQADAEVGACRATLEEAEAKRTLLWDQSQRSREELQACEAETGRLEVRLASRQGALERDQEVIGDAEQRATRLAAAERLVADVTAELVQLDATLAPLRAQDPDAVVGRLTRALEEATRQRDKALHARIEAGTLLRRDGATDPQEQVATAQAAWERAEQLVQHEQDRADAIRMLQGLLDKANSDLSQKYVRPLETAVERYLTPVLGAGVRVRLGGNTSVFEELTLSRPELGGAAMPFDTLSVGAKEQVAVAFRLAMADVLARERGEPLPVVLDDAFVNADPYRVRALHSMLDLAVRGEQLQLVVLSCTPSDYLGLGGAEVTLPRPRITGGGLPASEARLPAAEDREDEDDEERPDSADRKSTSAAPVAAGDGEEFLAELKRRGGSSGNKALREALGWDEARYDAVKDGLVAEGRVVKGQGRGGSVRAG